MAEVGEGSGRTRTCDPDPTKDLLYPLSSALSERPAHSGAFCLSITRKILQALV